MKIIISESQYAVLDWFSYNEEYFEKIFDHLTDGIYLTNFVWTNNLNLVCNKIIDKMIEKFEHKKITTLNDEQKNLLMNLYCERITNKFLMLKDNI